MAKYLFRVALTAEGVRNLRAQGAAAVRDNVDKMTRAVGGKIEAYYYAFGERDAIGIVDVPDNVSAATISLVANSAGLANSSLTPLLTVEEIDKAIEKGKSMPGPGGQA